MPKTQRLGGEEQKNVGVLFFFLSIYTNLLMFIFMDLLTHVYIHMIKKIILKKKLKTFLKFFFSIILSLFIFGVQVLKILHNLLFFVNEYIQQIVC